MKVGWLAISVIAGITWVILRRCAIDTAIMAYEQDKNQRMITSDRIGLKLWMLGMVHAIVFGISTGQLIVLLLKR